MTERTTVTVSVSLPPDIAAALKEHAEEEGLSQSLIVRWALENFFKKAARRLGHAAKLARRNGKNG